MLQGILLPMHYKASRGAPSMERRSYAKTQFTHAETYTFVLLSVL